MPRSLPCSALASKKGITFVDCAGPLLLTEAGNLNTTLVPDNMFPSPQGYDKIFSE